MSIPLRYGTTYKHIGWITQVVIWCQFLLGTVQQADKRMYVEKETYKVSIPLRYGTTFGFKSSYRLVAVFVVTSVNSS